MKNSVSVKVVAGLLSVLLSFFSIPVSGTEALAVPPSLFSSDRTPSQPGEIPVEQAVVQPSPSVPSGSVTPPSPLSIAQPEPIGSSETPEAEDLPSLEASLQSTVLSSGDLQVEIYRDHTASIRWQGKTLTGTYDPATRLVTATQVYFSSYQERYDVFLSEDGERVVSFVKIQTDSALHQVITNGYTLGENGELVSQRTENVRTVDGVTKTLSRTTDYIWINGKRYPVSEEILRQEVDSEGRVLLQVATTKTFEWYANGRIQNESTVIRTDWLAGDGTPLWRVEKTYAYYDTGDARLDWIKLLAGYNDQGNRVYWAEYRHTVYGDAYDYQTDVIAQPFDDALIDEIDGFADGDWSDDQAAIEARARGRSVMVFNYAGQSPQIGAHRFFWVSEEKNGDGIFVPRRLTFSAGGEVGELAFIVVGQVDALSGENDDIPFIEVQQVTAGGKSYWVEYGSYDRTAGWGLYFFLETSETVAVAHYPAEETVEINGWVYKIEIDERGVLSLVDPMPVVPEGWTRAASNVNFAFRILYTDPSETDPGNEILQVQDLVTKTVTTVYYRSLGFSSLWGAPDVSPDGAFTVFATRNMFGGSVIYVDEFAGEGTLHEFLAEMEMLAPAIPGDPYHFLGNEIHVDMAEGSGKTVAVYHINTVTWEGDLYWNVPEGWTQTPSNPDYAYRIETVGGETVLTLMHLSTGMTKEMLRVDASTGAIAPLCDVSPDGTVAVYGATEGGVGTIYVQDLSLEIKKRTLEGDLQGAEFLGEKLVRLTYDDQGTVKTAIVDYNSMTVCDTVVFDGYTVASAYQYYLILGSQVTLIPNRSPQHADILIGSTKVGEQIFFHFQYIPRSQWKTEIYQRYDIATGTWASITEEEWRNANLVGGWTVAASNPDYAYRVVETLVGSQLERSLILLDLQTGQQRTFYVTYFPDAYGAVDISPDGRLVYAVILNSFAGGGLVFGYREGAEQERTNGNMEDVQFTETGGISYVIRNVFRNGTVIGDRYEIDPDTLETEPTSSFLIELGDDAVLENGYLVIPMINPYSNTYEVHFYDATAGSDDLVKLDTTIFYHACQAAGGCSGSGFYTLVDVYPVPSGGTVVSVGISATGNEDVDYSRTFLIDPVTGASLVLPGAATEVSYEGDYALYTIGENIGFVDLATLTEVPLVSPSEPVLTEMTLAAFSVPAVRTVSEEGSPAISEKSSLARTVQPLTYQAATTSLASIKKGLAADRSSQLLLSDLLSAGSEASITGSMEISNSIGKPLTLQPLQYSTLMGPVQSVGSLLTVRWDSMSLTGE